VLQWDANFGIGALDFHRPAGLLKLRSKTNMTQVPYKGAGPALNDLLGEHVDFFFSGFPAAVAQVKAGKLKLLAVSTAKRSPAAPNVPTGAEASGIADFDLSLWQGIFAPRGMPEGRGGADQCRDQRDHHATGFRRAAVGRRRRRHAADD
jgi:tripartite-type tricarboxylate transporter receptor subunit TctC